MLIPDRFTNDEEARPRFGFNGMEREDEIAGLGNVYTTANRNYDARTARWFSLDPAKMKYLSQSPFNAFGNNPVIFKDPGGDDYFYYMSNYEDKMESTKVVKKQNGDITFFLPKWDRRIRVTEGDHQYFWTNTEDGQQYHIFSPYTIHGGDGNKGERGKYVRDFNNDIDDLISNGVIDNMTDQAGAYYKSGSNLPINGMTLFAISVLRFKNVSVSGGALDFKSQLPVLNDTEQNDSKGTLFEIDDTYYNRNEAGNFLYGYAAARLGWPLAIVKAGGEAYVDLRRIKAKIFSIFSKSSPGYHMQDDESWEVNALIKGYAYYMRSTCDKDSPEYKFYEILYNNPTNREDYYEGTEEVTNSEDSNSTKGNSDD